MTCSAEALVTDVPDVQTGLQELMARGYQFLHPRDANGEVLEIVGIRVRDNVVDVLRVNAEDDVTAMRVPRDEENLFSPKRVLWQSTGPVAVVLAETLALPDDRLSGSPAAPSRPAGKGR